MDQKLTPSLVYTAMPKYLAVFDGHIGAHVYHHNCYPITPWMYPAWMIDIVKRDSIREANARYIESADELWVYSLRASMFEDAVEERRGLDIHDGVAREIRQAEELGMNIEYWEMDNDSQSIWHLTEEGNREAKWELEKV